MADVAEDREGDTLYGIIIGLLYVVAVGVQVYVVVDEVTHGALTDEVKAWWRRFSAQAREAARIEAEVRAALPVLHYEAWQALEDAAQ